MANLNIGLLFPGFDLDVQILAGFPLDLKPHRVVPVRFARAVSGVANPAAPDIDDHGYTICPGGPTQGPSVGILSGSRIRVKLMRDRIGDDAKLFVTIDDESVATIEFPPDGTALSAEDTPADDVNPLRQADCVFLRGGTSKGGSRSAILSVHIGTDKGPVIAKLAVFQHPRIFVPVQLHRFTINGVAPRVGDDVAFKIVQQANDILAQAGVVLQALPTVQPESDTGFEVGGQINPDTQEPIAIFNTRPAPDVLNAYFFRTFRGPVLGMANNPQIDARAKTGFIFATEFHNGNVVDLPLAGFIMAHEVGHVLGLHHVGDGELKPVDTARYDIWSHRCLMHNRGIISAEADLPRSSPERIKVGYGRLADGKIRAGSLLTTKQRDAIPFSGEVSIMRGAASSGKFKP